MHDVCSDAEMIAMINAAQHGDPKTYGQIYTIYADKPFRYLHLRLGEREPAEDLMSEVFVRLIRMLPRYRINSGRPVAGFSAWLYRIAATCRPTIAAGSESAVMPIWPTRPISSRMARRHTSGAEADEAVTDV